MCAYLPPSAKDLAESLIDENVKEDPIKWKRVQLELPIFFKLMGAMSEPKLPLNFKGVVLHLMDKSEAPFPLVYNGSSEGSAEMNVIQW